MKKILKRSMKLSLAVVLVLGLSPVHSFTAQDGPRVERIAGDNRYATAAAVSRDTYPKAETVIVALGEDYADALSSGQLAVAAKAPILLSRRNALPRETKNELDRLNVKKIYIVGGENALSEKVEMELKRFASTERIEGRDRYKTSEAIAEKAKELGMSRDFLIASGKNFPDSLASGGTVAKNKQSLALSNGEKLPSVDYKSITLLGGTNALPLPRVSAKRIARKNRYDTALQLAKNTFKKPKTIILASGENFPDALTAVSLAAKYDAPILLSRKDILDFDSLSFIKENSDKLIIVGGTAAVDPDVAAQLTPLKKDKATITFVPNFEKTPVTVKTNDNGKITPPEISRKGYTLKGWNTKADGSGKMVDLHKETFTEDTILYAIWEKSEVTVTFRYNYFLSPADIIQSLKTGSKASAPALANRKQYSFKGWNTKSDGTGESVDLNKKTFTKDTVLYAIWKGADTDTTITFDYNYKGAPANAVQFIKSGTTVPAPALPNREHYVLKGWSTNPNGYRLIDLKKETFSRDAVLYAVWERIEITINFNYNYENAPANHVITIKSGENAYYASQPGRKDYPFIGWNTKADGSGKMIDLYKETFSKDTTLYAIWGKKITLTLNYNYPDAPKDVVQSISEDGYMYGRVDIPYRDKERYQFKGWNTKSDGSGKMINPYNEKFSNDTTLYAIWEKQKVSIYFNYNYPDSPERVIQQIEENGTVTSPSIPSRELYDFKGWTRNYYGEGEVVDLNTETFSEDTGLFAVWERKKVSVTFDYNYPEAPEDSIQTIEIGNTAAFPKDIIRDGYYIESWNTKEDGTGEDIDLTSKTFSKQAALYAQWKKGTSGIIFDAPTQTVTGYTGTDYNITIPSRINGKDVTKIGYSAFNNKRLTSVIIPNTVTEIESGAFGDNKLMSIDIPNSVTSIGYAAFRNNRLTSVVIPESVTTLGENAFLNNSLTSLTISNSIKKLPSTVFANNQLISVEIPNSVTVIEASAFMSNKLTSVTLPDSVTTIGANAFSNNQLTTINIPNSVKTIGQAAFANNSLGTVILPNALKIIENSAFARNKLTSVTIPNSVNLIGTEAFISNELATVIIPNSVAIIEENAFSNNQLTSVSIPDSVTTIESFAFSQNAITGTVRIPKSVDYLGRGFIAVNPNLTAIEIHKDKSYPAEAFISGMDPEQYTVTQYE